MNRVPIRLRVAIAFAVAMAAVLAGTSWALYDRLDAHLRTALDRDLRLRAQDLAAVAGDPGASLAVAGRSRLVEPGESYAQLLDRSGRVLDATAPLRASLLDTAELARAEHGTLFADRARVPGLDEPSRLLATPVARAGRRFVLVVGATAQDRVETLASFRDELLVAGPVALVVASLAGFGLAGLSLRPVESMRRRAATISAETPGERLPLPGSGDEIERLAETLNVMLDRLEAGLERERGFVADAGHELRTPLALVRTELELALRHGESVEELRAAVRSASAEVERLARLAEDMLLSARAAGGLPLRLERLDVAELVSTVVSRFSTRAAEAGRRVDVSVPAGLWLEGDRIRLEQALGNLVDNALRHGDGSVSVSARPGGREVVELHVRDDGRGLSDRLRERAFERFARDDPARPGHGTGLGLSIVRTIAEAHGGTASLANRPRGGLDIWIALPVAAAARLPA